MDSLYLFFNFLLFSINIKYIRYWIMVFKALKGSHINTFVLKSSMIEYAIKYAKEKGNTYKFRIRIVTKGGHPEVVYKGIDAIYKSFVMYPCLKDIVNIDVVTENRKDIDILSGLIGRNSISMIVVPIGYKTKNNTSLKARSLQYMVDQEVNNKTDEYIVHFDEESVLTPHNLAHLIIQLLKNPVDISEGVISYGNDWKKANILCRAIESGRPFGCCECYNLIKEGKAPYHLHGSNLVVKRKIEREIGWDHGKLKNNDLVAEDLIFGMKAFFKLGPKSFGWHYAEMIEQPPFTIQAAIKQRERWVMGTLQGIEYASKIPEYNNLSLFKRIKIKLGIWYNVLSFALSFPLSLFTTVVNIIVLIDIVRYFIFDGHHFVFANWTVIFILGTVLWIASLQFGLFYNLRYSDLNTKEKIIEHFKILLVTPIAGFVETYGAFKSLVRWTMGKRNLTWIVTPKYTDKDVKAFVTNSQEK